MQICYIMQDGRTGAGCLLYTRWALCTGCRSKSQRLRKALRAACCTKQGVNDEVDVDVDERIELNSPDGILRNHASLSKLE